MTTMQILSAAYAELFAITPRVSGHYAGEILGQTEIDYADFAMNSMDFDYDADHIEAVVETGSEGCWIGLFRVRIDAGTRHLLRDRIGTIKTLDEGRKAWHDMGALAGELTYMADVTAWEILRQCY